MLSIRNTAGSHSVYDYETNATRTIASGPLTLSFRTDLSENMLFWNAANSFFTFDFAKDIPIENVATLPSSYSQANPFALVSGPDFSNEHVTSVKNSAFSAYEGEYLSKLIPSLETINSMQSADPFPVVLSPTPLQSGANGFGSIANSVWWTAC